MTLVSNRWVWVTPTLVLLGCSYMPWKKSTPPDTSCSSSREYVTTLSFLRDHNDLAGNEKQAREVADHVSKGCTGAARRFIGTVRVLKDAEVGNGTVLDLGIQLANSTEATAAAFNAIFQSVYLESRLDLDAGTALRISRDLSLNFKGRPDRAQRDFTKLVDFCRSESSLNLSQAQCAEFSARITNSGPPERGDVFPEFESVYTFLIEQSDARPSVSEAVRLAEEVVKKGPWAAENFKQAYRYAKSKKGLELTAEDSVAFAMKMAERSTRLSPLEPMPKRGLFGRIVDKLFGWL